MTNYPEESGYKDLIGEADPAGAKLAADLQALYAAPAPGLRFTPPPELPARLPGARRWRRWQPAMAAAVAVAGLAAVLIAPSLWQTESRVNAETVFARASTVAETSAPADGPAAYHLIATTETPGKAGTSTTETWYADSSHIRSEQDYDPANAGADFGTLVRGDQAWLYGSIDGVYRAVHGPASELGVGFVGGMPGSGTATDLSQVLGQYTGGCQVARADGEDTIVGRAAYKIAVTMDFNTCPVPDAKADPGKMGPLTLWVDRETFLPLKTEQLDTAGGMMYVYEVTQIEVGGPIPDSAFEYVPPVGVAVQDVANLTEAKFILSGYTKDGVPAQ